MNEPINFFKLSEKTFYFINFLNSIIIVLCLIQIVNLFAFGFCS